MHDRASGYQLQAVIALAKEAGEAILKVYEEGGWSVVLKSDQSPVTRADMKAHQIIVARLQALTPALPVLSEESKGVPYQERQQWRAYWLVDPLDGTKE